MAPASQTDELAYWVALHSAEGMGPVTFRRLLDRFGTAKAALEESDDDSLLGVQGMTGTLANAIRNARNAVSYTHLRAHET